MKKLIVTLFTAMVLTITIHAEIRTWTAKDGGTIEAEFVKEKFNYVYLKASDGSEKKINLSNLSKPDQELIGRLTDPFAAKKAAEAAEAAAKPKAPKAIHKLFGDTLRNAEDEKISVDELAGKKIGIYFSAHWCPPCRGFTPSLVDFHNEVTNKGEPFEIVFVSSDRDENAMYDYMEEMDMPWLALEYGDRRKKELASKYNVSGIPKLVIIDEDGDLITENGRGDVSQYGKGAYAKWK